MCSVMNFFLLLINIIIPGAAADSVIFSKAISNIACHESERQALLSFKHGLTDPSHRLSSWVEGRSCCDWHGVVCHNLTGHVLELRLRGRITFADYYSSEDPYGNKTDELPWLGGNIDTSLLDLKHLRYLDLSKNYFGGIQVPVFFGSMRNLRYLNLSAAGFGGMIPPHLGNLSNLRYLSLGHELGYVSYVDNLQWLSGLSMLKHLDLSYVSLQNVTDKLQGTYALPSLEELHLEGCDIYNIPLLPHGNFSNLLVLDLSANLISASSFHMPWWGFGLNSLVSLDLSDVYIDGPIPSCLQNLTSLKYLDLSFCNLNSTLPNWLYKFSRLEKLILFENSLQGIISQDIANLTLLKYLDLSYNDLQGKIPRSMRTMCNFEWVDLSHLNLRQNVSQVLKSFAGCASNRLQYLSLLSTEVFGPLSDELGRFTNLKRLDLSYNSVSGPIPESLGSLTSLIELDLSNNQIDGTLPQSLGQLHRLEHLNLDQNRISGRIPNSVGSLTSLIELHLSGNQLSGPLPESLGQLSKLEYFNIDHSSMEGNISEVFFANLSRLSVFRAPQSPITLKVSPNWIPPFQLTELSLSSWHLGPKFPKWLSSQYLLSYLDISNARIEDTIPTFFWNMSSRLSYMNLSYNYLYGEISSNKTIIGALDAVIDLSNNNFTGPLPRFSTGIVALDLSANSFSGHISRLLCDGTNQMKYVARLYLGNNELTGEIPDCWSSWPLLAAIELQNNNLIGNLPSSLGSLSILGYFHARNNSLSGVLPSSLQNCTNLVALDLAENNLGGTIPIWIGQKLSNIRILNLRHNNFHGYIPSEICALTSLIILDLAHNNLSATIPKCLANLSAMVNLSNLEFSYSYGSPLAINGKVVFSSSTYEENAILITKALVLEYGKNLQLMTAIDLSDNSLWGSIPEAITNLVELKSLNLSGNSLTGKIPQNIGNLSSLESLDLSLNHLSGKIPQGMAGMTFLGFLNLSYNNLTGRIPTSTQLQSFSASSYIGNNLSGPPLSDNWSTSGSAPSEQNENRNHNHGPRFDEFYVSMSLGFVVGLGIVVAPLLYSNSWRFQYFRWLQSMWDKLWIWAALLIRARFGGPA